MRRWLKSIPFSAWFKFVWGTILWAAITFLFLVPRYSEIANGEAKPFDILILLIWVALPLMLLFAEVEIFGFKLKHWQTKPFDADKKVPPPETKGIGKSEAPEVPPPETEGSDIIVEYREESPPIVRENQGLNTFLSLKARIHFTHVAGFTDLMRIKVNGQTLKAQHSVNKDIDFKIADGRDFSWFNPEIISWCIPYSPDFKSNYSHSKYRVLNGDPYSYLFDLSLISPDKDGKYNIVVEHNGKTGNDAFENAIVVRDVKTF